MFIKGITNSAPIKTYSKSKINSTNFRSRNSRNKKKLDLQFAKEVCRFSLFRDRGGSKGTLDTKISIEDYASIKGKGKATNLVAEMIYGSDWRSICELSFNNYRTGVGAFAEAKGDLRRSSGVEVDTRSTMNVETRGSQAVTETATIVVRKPRMTDEGLNLRSSFMAKPQVFIVVVFPWYREKDVPPVKIHGRSMAAERLELAMKGRAIASKLPVEERVVTMSWLEVAESRGRR